MRAYDIELVLTSPTRTISPDVKFEFRYIVPAFLEEKVYCSELAIGRSPFGFAVVKERLYLKLRLQIKTFLKNLHQHGPTTAEIFAQPLLTSYKRDKHLSNYLVKSTLKSDHQPGTFKCAHVRYKGIKFRKKLCAASVGK